MKGHEEVELKLVLCDAALWDALGLQIAAMAQGEVERIAMAAVYFDTADGALRASRVAYRVRKENARWTATIKSGGSSAGGLHRREEWNVNAEGSAPDLGVFYDAGVDAALLDALRGKELVPIVETEFTRMAAQLFYGGARIEAALDQGEIRAGGKSVPILELELELKDGSSSELMALGMLLAQRFSLEPETRSKFFRGLVLGGRARS